MTRLSDMVFLGGDVDVIVLVAVWLKRNHIPLDFIDPGWSMRNGFIDSIKDGHRREVLDIHVFRAFGGVRE